MATLAESVDCADKDFDALRARLIALIKSVFPDWTDFDVADFGNLLVKLYAYVGDVLTFYQDRRATRRTTTTGTTHLGGEHGYLHPDANIDANDCLMSDDDTPARIGGVTTGDRIDMATLTKLMA